jgi:DNA-directed RNA polymerase subunit M/transcription elongation factor TFIIS
MSAPPSSLLVGIMPVESEQRRNPRMDQPPIRTCPACGSGDYTFRSRKKIEAAEGQEAATETKYRCKTCGKEWKVKVAG